MVALYPGKSIFGPNADILIDCGDTEWLNEIEIDETNSAEEVWEWTLIPWNRLIYTILKP